MKSYDFNVHPSQGHGSNCFNISSNLTCTQKELTNKTNFQRNGTIQKLDKGVGAAGGAGPQDNNKNSSMLGIDSNAVERNLWFQQLRQDIQDHHTDQNTEGKTEVNHTNQASEASISKQDDWEKSKASIHAGDQELE